MKSAWNFELKKLTLSTTLLEELTQELENG